MEDLAVRPDVERPSGRDTHPPQHTVRVGDFFRPVRENRVIRFHVLSEFLVGLRVVDADREVGDVVLPDGSAALTERLAFGRSSAGEGFWEPREHDGALAFVIGESM